jgi:hypothetical protein
MDLQLTRKLCLYYKPQDKLIWKGGKLPDYLMSEYLDDKRGKRNYILFDSVGEYKCYRILLNSYESKQILIHYRIKLPYLDWRVDFKVGERVIEYKETIDNNFQMVLSSLITYYPSLWKKLEIASNSLSTVTATSLITKVKCNKTCILPKSL